MIQSCNRRGISVPLGDVCHQRSIEYSSTCTYIIIHFSVYNYSDISWYVASRWRCLGSMSLHWNNMTKGYTWLGPGNIKAYTWSWMMKGRPTVVAVVTGNFSLAVVNQNGSSMLRASERDSLALTMDNEPSSELGNETIQLWSWSKREEPLWGLITKTAQPWPWTMNQAQSWTPRPSGSDHGQREKNPLWGLVNETAQPWSWIYMKNHRLGHLTSSLSAKHSKLCSL